MSPDLVLEVDELVYCDKGRNLIAVSKDIFDDFAEGTYIDILFTDSDEICSYVMISETHDSIIMGILA